MHSIRVNLNNVATVIFDIKVKLLDILYALIDNFLFLFRSLNVSKRF